MLDNKKNILTISLIFTILILFFFIGCLNKIKKKLDNTYYIELINFTKDSLKQSVLENILGKVAYYKDSKLIILSLNYLTEDHLDMHYFRSVEEIKKETIQNTKKIRIEFGGAYTPDSITYSLQKFIYKNKNWKKTSDMGFIKGTTTYVRAKQFAIKEFTKQIINNIVLYSYN